MLRSLATFCAAAGFGLCLTVPAFAQTEWEKPAREFHVSVTGNDAAAGTQDAPFRTLERAQAAVRSVNDSHDVTIRLHAGEYHLERPLRFTAEDGGQNGFSVTWKGLDNQLPVISGGQTVTGWKHHDKARNLYVADVPKGLEARQLWVNDRLASRASISVSHKDFTFREDGLIISNPALNYLAGLPDQGRIEIEQTAYFTNRYAQVDHIDGQHIVMKQPGWANNIWGYDNIYSPYHPEDAKLRLVNALAFLNEAGQWYLDPAAGKLYYKPRPGEDMKTARVVLPRLEALVSIAGTAGQPVMDLTFEGLRFSYTSWLGPSGAEGYASQQSGSFLSGKAEKYPDNVFVTCRWGCPAFESVRNTWHQMPAAVQVAAAWHITFEGNVFAHLGQYALGIGNDDTANISGIGLGTVDITVARNIFTDLAGGAILSGGVRPDAHHPSDPHLVNRQLMIRNNLIHDVSRDYKDNSALISTYVDGAWIVNNDISGAPYDAIDIGYGWGYVDQGGNPRYRKSQRGYDRGMNPVYTTPTTRRDVVVAYNRVHRVKTLFKDGGAIYNLSACPDCVIAENHIFDIGPRVAIYLDEGSRGLMVRHNVVEGDVSRWLNVNTAFNAVPIRTSVNNTALSNWHAETVVGGIWNRYMNNLIIDDHIVRDNQWPAEALQVMSNAGIEPQVTLPAYGDVRPDPRREGLPPPIADGRGTYLQNSHK